MKKIIVGSWAIIGLLISIMTCFLIKGEPFWLLLIGRSLWIIFFTFTGLIIDWKVADNIIIEHIKNNTKIS